MRHCAWWVGLVVLSGACGGGGSTPADASEDGSGGDEAIGTSEGGADESTSDPGGDDSSDDTGAVVPEDGLVLVGDADRNGQIDAADQADDATWSWTRGAFVLANLDDDDADGLADADDDRPNGAEDVADLATLQLHVGAALVEAGASLTVEITTGAAAVRVFRRDGDEWVALDRPFASADTIELGAEALSFADASWDGLAQLRATAHDAAGQVLATDEVAVRVAPWIMLPFSAPASELHVATGHYANAAFLEGLGAVADQQGLALRVHESAAWQEMWMQDTMEIGYTQLPGRAPMHVVLQANRGADSYPATLLGPDLGYLRIGETRGLSGGDTWADWYGNLEVSLPVEGWPLGRIYYGLNPETGVSLHPEVVEFIEAQAVQAPFWVDTGWLTIKHVDEILAFVPGPDGPRILVVSPQAAGELYPDYYDAYNRGLQERIDRTLYGGSYDVAGTEVEYPGVLAELGLDASAVLELPLFYSDGHNDWSNPVNSLFVNGVLVAGDTYMYEPERAVTEAALGEVDVSIAWVNDAVYQDNLGNVHCATNATRLPLVENFATALPASTRQRRRR